MVPPPIHYGCFSSLFIWLLFSAIVFAYERRLVPLYGSVPTNLHTIHIVVASMAAAAVTPAGIIRVITSNPSAPANYFIFVVPLLALMPTATYLVGVYSARLEDPWMGPFLTHLIVLLPIGYLFAVSSLGLSLPDFSNHKYIYRLLSATWAPLVVWFSYRLCLAMSGIHPWHLISIYSDDQISISVAFIIIIAWILWRLRIRHSSPISHSKAKVTGPHFFELASVFGVVFGLISILLPSWRSPVLPHPLLKPFTHPVHPLKILSSIQSTTGLIVVGELLPPLPSSNGDSPQLHSLRYLRASHSLLGGVWLGDNIVSIDGTPAAFDEEGTPLGDSIYTAFLLQEAIRLVNVKEISEDDSGTNALIIGLGAGISASAFSRHNISTTIVEIDPAVYDAARRYFGMPDPGVDNVFLEDASGWVAKRASATDVGKASFDFVVHDCFSGGGVPAHIFTLEFWKNLKTIVKPHGVVAINFAGKLKSDSSRAILLTLQSVFTMCRAFHNSLQPLSEEQYENDFMDIVFFCTVSPHPLTFRPARHSDYLNSHLRQIVLSSLPDREINSTIITGNMSSLTEEEKAQWILTDAHNPLGPWEEKSAFGHWKLMRKAIPHWVWETY